MVIIWMWRIWFFRPLEGSSWGEERWPQSERCLLHTSVSFTVPGFKNRTEQNAIVVATHIYNTIKATLVQVVEAKATVLVILPVLKGLCSSETFQCTEKIQNMLRLEAVTFYIECLERAKDVCNIIRLVMCTFECIARVVFTLDVCTVRDVADVSNICTFLTIARCLNATVKPHLMFSRHVTEKKEMSRVDISA